MNDYTLGAEKLAELRAAHRETRDKREADRIKAVVLLGTGWSAEQVAEVLQVDPNTVRNHFRRYQQGGIKALGQVTFRGSACALDEAQLAALDLHLQFLAMLFRPQAVILAHEALLRPVGNVVYFMPPYVIEPGEIDQLVTTARDGIEAATCD